MADVVVTIPISDVSYTTWLRTSQIGASLSKEGVPLPDSAEMGPDQEDAFANFTDEASREVLKVYVSRQGDATGDPFEQTATDIIYRFNEAIPVLPQAATIKSSLGEDTKNAIYTFITILWFKLKMNEDQLIYLKERYEKLVSNIENHLYKLHD